MASPASPYLASTLLDLSSPSQLPPPASSGSFAIDTSALGGGYRYGEITSIAGPTGTGKSLLGFHAIVSHLLAEIQGEGKQVDRIAGREVALIDTTGGFSVLRLRDVLVFRLKARWQRRGGYGDGRAREGGGDFAEEAAEMLGRVRVMRVFDLVGVMEALGEIGEKKGKEREIRQEERKREIEDSEDEDEDSGDGGTEMQPRNDDEDQKGGGNSSVGMIVIDTITNVVSSVVSQSPIQGQALLARCMRTIQHLTTRHQLCSILINSAVGLRPSANPQHRLMPDDDVSIFASSLGKPALGKAFTFFIDTSVFLSLMPKTQEDATTAYGDFDRGRTWSKAIVLEVLKDKKGTREGRWAGFEIVDSVKLVPCFT